MNKILYNVKELQGEKIISVDVIRAEYGRTYNEYACFVCESGKRVMVAVHNNPWNAEPPIEEMRKTQMFTPEEIGEKLIQIETKKRQREKEDRERKKRELERLKRELGEN